jgi:hypothetical protein
MIEQNSTQWMKDRLGCFNGSAIGDLMSSGRKKDELFGQTALSYIYSIASERDLLKAYTDDDYLWEVYQSQVAFSNKYTDWGHEQEPFAVEEYEKRTGRMCEETQRILHSTIPNYASSPDRLAYDGEEKIVVEIKSPLPKTYMKYRHEIKDNETLKAVEPKYFYQVQAEMHTSGCTKADIVFFCPFLKHHLHIVRITADEEIQKEIEHRIAEAEKIIQFILTQNQ